MFLRICVDEHQDLEKFGFEATHKTEFGWRSLQDLGIS